MTLRDPLASVGLKQVLDSYKAHLLGVDSYMLRSHRKCNSKALRRRGATIQKTTAIPCSAWVENLRTPTIIFGEIKKKFV